MRYPHKKHPGFQSCRTIRNQQDRRFAQGLGRLQKPLGYLLPGFHRDMAGSSELPNRLFVGGFPGR
jgi:hypothetical protein